MLFRRLNVICLALFAAFMPSHAALQAEEAETKAPRFIRLGRDAEKEMASLDTAIARYTLSQGDCKDPVIVDLIGAVHVGEKTYYQRLDKKFKEYDVLLYELVAPKNTRVPKGGKRNEFNPVSGLQMMMKDALRLEFQLEQIDYQAKNFVHADMSPEEFAASMKRLDESPIKMFFQLMRASIAQQAESKNPPVNDAVLLAALFDRKKRSDHSEAGDGPSACGKRHHDGGAQWPQRLHHCDGAEQSRSRSHETANRGGQDQDRNLLWSGSSSRYARTDAPRSRHDIRQNRLGKSLGSEARSS